MHVRIVSPNSHVTTRLRRPEARTHSVRPGGHAHGDAPVGDQKRGTTCRCGCWQFSWSPNTACADLPSTGCACRPETEIFSCRCATSYFFLGFLFFFCHTSKVTVAALAALYTLPRPAPARALLSRTPFALRPVPVFCLAAAICSQLPAPPLIPSLPFSC